MKKILSKLLGGALLFGLTMSLTSCEDILGHWEKPTPNPITPTVDDVIKYGFKVTDLNGDDKTTLVTSLKMSNSDGPVATAEVSGGKITIKADDLKEITSAIDFWFEAEIDGKPYIAKVNINPTALSPESDNTLAMATLGDMILDDGTFAVSSSAGTKVAKIAYLGNDAETNTHYNHGLALALVDVSETKKWCNQTSVTCLVTQYDNSTKFNDLAGIDNTDALVGTTPHNHGDNAAKAARGYNGGTHPTGTSAWFLPSAGQWDKMIGTGGYGLTNLKTDANGYTGLQESAYWSSTEFNASNACDFLSSFCNLGSNSKNNNCRVRACLAF